MTHYKSPIALRYIIHLVVLFYLFTVSSCMIYHKKTTSLEETINSKQNVKVVFTDGRKMHFKDLVREEGILYGIQRTKGQLNKVIIPEDQIKEIHQKNKNASGGLSFVLGVGVFVGLIYILAANISYQGI